MTVTGIKNTRRKNDFYFTELSAVRVLLEHLDLEKDYRIFESCNGTGNISDVLKETYNNVLIGDKFLGDNYFDATSELAWYGVKPDFTITNPPFCAASEIIPLAYEYSKIGCAMLLRLSYLEPCDNRGQWLFDHPVSKLITLPRISFTGDGGKDKVATAWYIWDKRTDKQQIIHTRKTN